VYIGTEHLVLALARRAGDTPGLERLGIDWGRVRARIAEFVPADVAGPAPDHELPHTERTKRVFALAGEGARALGRTRVGVQHLLLGLMREGQGIGAYVLAEQGLTEQRALESAQGDGAGADVPVTTRTLEAFLAAFNAHDLDAIMGFFADDCEFLMPRGTEPWGTRYVGKAAVREGLATRFAGLPDVHYGEDTHWVCGSHGVSTWLLTGTTRSGEAVRVRGVDLLEFREGMIVRKDSYWKIVQR
jgi:ketosteroid isomerase-like protein